MNFKSCPFCNGKAKVQVNINPESHLYSKWFVECSRCGIITKPFASKEEVNEAWNKRHDGKTQEQIIDDILDGNY